MNISHLRLDVTIRNLARGNKNRLEEALRPIARN